MVFHVCGESFLASSTTIRSLSRLAIASDFGDPVRGANGEFAAAIVTCGASDAKLRRERPMARRSSADGSGGHEE